MAKTTKATPQDPMVAHLGRLIGRTAVAIAVNDDDPEFHGLVFRETDLARGQEPGPDLIAWILRDPEGNGPGFLSIEERRG